MLPLLSPWGWCCRDGSSQLILVCFSRPFGESCGKKCPREAVRTSPSPQQRPLCSLFQSLRATPPFGNQRPLLYGFLRPRSIPLANANTRVTQTTPFLRARAFRRRKRKMVSPCNPTDSIFSSSGRVETLFQGVHVSLIFS